MGTAVNYSLINNLFPLSTYLPGSVPVTINNSLVAPQWFGPSLVIHSGVLLWLAIEAHTSSFSYSLIPAAVLFHVPDLREIAMMGSTIRLLNCPFSLLTARQALPLGSIMLSAPESEIRYKLFLSKPSPSHADFTACVTLEFIWTSICSSYMHTSLSYYKVSLTVYFYCGSSLTDVHASEIRMKRQLRLCIDHLFEHGKRREKGSDFVATSV